MNDSRICPKFEAAFAILGKRWTGLIVRVLLTGKCRFTDLSDAIPQMSDRMLAERLKELEQAGIVTRNVFPETPIRIEYELTEKGITLKPIMDHVQSWADRWIGVSEDWTDERMGLADKKEDLASGQAPQKDAER